jgi:chemotaxis signal transduction protein
MALNSTSLGSKGGKDKQNRQVFTFFIEDMMFGLDVENVLMLGQEVNEIQRLPVEERGFCGVVRFQGELVPVLDYAHRIGIDSGVDVKSELIEILTVREQEHVDWLNALEQSIRTGVMFSNTIDPKRCEFGKWYSTFVTRDETLKELLQSFEEPHRKIHNLAETLLALRDEGKQDEAITLLKYEKQTTLRRLQALFERARDQIKGGMRPVLLYVTTDGKTPRYALMIDEINDVINYTAADYQSSLSGGLALFNKIDDVIDGIYTKPNLPDCLYFDVNQVADTDHLMANVS